VRVVSIGEDAKLTALAFDLESGNVSETYSYTNARASRAVGVIVHPLGWLALAAYADGSFSYHDLRTVIFLLTFISKQKFFK
jgi:hypothetical protein